MPPVIFDALGNIRPWEWMLGKYGEVCFNEYPGPNPCWRLVAIVEDADYGNVFTGVIANRTRAGLPWWPGTEATAALVVKALDQFGVPACGIRVARHWPDAPILPDDAQHWDERGVLGETNANGDVGFGMGPGDYYYPPNHGVSALWVAQPGVHSDSLSYLGMLGGTNHNHLNGVFQFYPEPSDPPPDDEVADYVRHLKTLLSNCLEDCAAILEILGEE